MTDWRLHKMNKHYFLVLDVETANSVNEPLVYDVGFAICDRKGNVYLEESYAISEIFFDERKIYHNSQLMDTAYYAEKLPQYWNGMKKGDWKIASLLTVRKRILELIKEYNIKAVCAYNANFDVNALNQSIRYITKSNVRYFFPYGTEIYCIWHMACQVLFTQKTYCKVANRENWESEKGNVLTNAEVAWRYMTKIYDFEESHTGLADVRIECQIMAKCFAQHKKMNRNINRLCWRIPQPQYKALKVA